MDMREIEQLHAQYSQPALTIDITPSGAIRAGATLSLGGTSSGEPDARERSDPVFGQLKNSRAMWVLVFALALAATFAVGSSLGKRGARSEAEARVQNADTSVKADSSQQADADSPQRRDHEWPQRRIDPPTESASQVQAVVASPSPDSAASVAAAAPAPQPTKPNSKPTAPARSAASSSNISSTAMPSGKSPASSGQEIKLF